MISTHLEKGMSDIYKPVSGDIFNPIHLLSSIWKECNYDEDKNKTQVSKCNYDDRYKTH